MSFSSILGRKPSSSNVLVLAQEQVLEGDLEGVVAEGIAGGVDGAVDVAEPVQCAPQCFWDAVVAECVDKDHDVVRRPCDDKSNHDSHDGARHFFFPASTDPPSPLFQNLHPHITIRNLRDERRRRYRFPR